MAKGTKGNFTINHQAVLHILLIPVSPLQVLLLIIILLLFLLIRLLLLILPQNNDQLKTIHKLRNSDRYYKIDFEMLVILIKLEVLL